MSVLAKIISKKKERLSEAKRAEPLSMLKGRIKDARPPRDFASAIRRPAGDMARAREGGIRLIAEIKRASPSRGVIRRDLDPAAIAAIYERGASAISVITEEDFFGGRLSYIAEVKQASARPVLRKDFILDEYQIYEARAAGADAILLIGAALEGAQAGEYLHAAAELGMAVLFEVHDHGELEGALKAGAGIIGINNRNLKTLAIDLQTTARLIRELPKEYTAVSESGIGGREDALMLEALGVDAMLVGTSLMESSDIAAGIDALLGVRQGAGA